MIQMTKQDPIFKTDTVQPTMAFITRGMRAELEAASTNKSMLLLLQVFLDYLNCLKKVDFSSSNEWKDLI
jgi:hypothetical protein